MGSVVDGEGVGRDTEDGDAHQERNQRDAYPDVVRQLEGADLGLEVVLVGIDLEGRGICFLGLGRHLEPGWGFFSREGFLGIEMPYSKVNKYYTMNDSSSPGKKREGNKERQTEKTDRKTSQGKHTLITLNKEDWNRGGPKSTNTSRPLQ